MMESPHGPQTQRCPQGTKVWVCLPSKHRTQRLGLPISGSKLAGTAVDTVCSLHSVLADGESSKVLYSSTARCSQASSGVALQIDGSGSSEMWTLASKNCLRLGVAADMMTGKRHDDQLQASVIRTNSASASMLLAREVQQPVAGDERR